MPRIVIVGYRPKPGKAEELDALMRTHLPILQQQGLATNRPSYLMKAADGTVIEVFEWVSEEAIQQAHTNPAVLAMWEQYEACCEYVPAGHVAEINHLFSAFAPFE